MTAKYGTLLLLLLGAPNATAIEWSTPLVIYMTDQVGDDLSTKYALSRGAQEGGAFARRNGPLTTSAFNIAAEMGADLALQYGSNQLARVRSGPLQFVGKKRLLVWAFRAVITARFAIVTVHNVRVAHVMERR